MNKFSKYFAAFASVALFAACSSDEPANVGNENEAEKSHLYLAVNISDAKTAGSRAGLDEADNEGDFKRGNEHTISSAHFFFFNAEGVYVTQAGIWNGGDDNEDDNLNIEYIGNNVVMLEGLTAKNMPNYVITVLNAPQTLVSYPIPNMTTIEEFRNYPLNSYLNGDKYIMSTSSFRGGNTDLYNDDMFFANKIPNGYFYTEPITDLANAKALDIYVERLAAKFTLNANSRVFSIRMTVAGEGNDNNNTELVAGDTQLKVTIDGFGVTTTEKTSYLSKNLLADWTKDYKFNNTWTNWNDVSNFRSYWGASVNYENEVNAESFDHSFVPANVTKDAPFDAVYALENTHKYAGITRENTSEVDASKVTNFVVKATITNADGSAITDLVSYNGVLFKDDQFKKYILSNLQLKDKLNYWKQTSSTTETNNGITDSGQTYDQVSVDDFGYVKIGNGGKMGVELTFAGDLYSYDPTAEPGSKFTKIEAPKATVDSDIKGVIGNTTPVRYNGGQTVYTIPVQHLLGDDSKYPAIAKDGEYGVVRNHWYELSVSKVSKLGQGVFKPGTADDSDRVYPDPDPDPETYGMAASIKVLSWKIVRQSVEL